MRFNKTDKFFSLTTLLIFSFVIHLSIVLLISLIPPEKKKALPSLLTRLVTPEEFAGMKPHGPQGSSGAVHKKADITQAKRQVIIPAVKGKISAPGLRRAAPIGPRQGSPTLPQANPAAQGVEKTDVLPQTPVNGGDSTGGSSEGSGSYSQSRKGGGNAGGASRLSNREKLFDRTIIAGIAAKEELKKDNTVRLDTKDFKYGPYMGRLRDRIEGVWKYPAEAARRGIYGDLEITFTINKNGRLSDIEVTRTSGHSSLDAAAVQALKDGEPYWPLPDDWGKDTLTIPGHFTYTIYGTGLR